MSDEQYRRAVSLIVSGADLDGLDLSQLRIKFSVKRSDTATPNTAEIRVYNLERTTAEKIKKEFNKVTLQAGYVDNYGVIFQGNIYQVIIGRESGTDTFVDIIAADGDRAYNFAVVNATLAAGATQADQANAAVQSMASRGVSAGNLGEFPTQSLPRGKVMFGASRRYLSDVSQTTDKNWSIQNEKVVMIPLKSYLPGEAVLITSKTGMIGAPQQTEEGINVKCLLNPRINVGQRIQVDNAAVQGMKINLNVKPDPNSIRGAVPAKLSADGTYYVLVAEQQGDTRGTEWYTSLICLNIAISSNPRKSVQVNYGG